jgi:putative membrane protein insertion efficiency factor
MNKLNTLVAYMAKGFIKFYRYIVSPMFAPSCRFQPTCSSYALKAIDRFGGLKGVWLAMRRIGRCHPWGGQGFDPVPKEDQLNKKNNQCCSGHKLH